MNKSEKCSITQQNRIVVHKGDTERRVYESELNNYLLDGWSKGISDKHRISTSKSHKGKSSTKGIPKSEECKRKISESLKGNIPWNKGLDKSDDRVRRSVEASSNTKIKRYGSAFPNNNMNEEHKQKISLALKGKTSPNKGKSRPKEVGDKISKAKVGHTVSDETRKKISDSKMGKKLPKEKLLIKTSKQYLTRKKNDTFNTSESEQLLYEKLLKENTNKTIYRNYKCKRYPFYCDFYIKEDDLFIELNAHWTHGGRPFDENDESCLAQLSEWTEKAKTSKFYANAIETWTVRDVAKLKCAKENHLNYKVIY